MSQKYFKCEHCGNIYAVVNDAGVPVVCCGEKMTPMVPGSVDASVEKHLPVISQDGNKVTLSVGSVTHPMVEEHYIMWMAIETKQGHQRKNLSSDAAPEVSFMLTDGDELVAAYAYCNLHGLWKTEA